MGLNLLAPLALLGTVLVAVPVVLHLIDRRRVPRVDFPPLRLLLAAQKRLKRRRRIRDPWLLAIRILVLLALILAYARPTVTYESTTRAGADLGGNVVFLLDTSLSMGYEVEGQTLLDQAKARALEVLGRMKGRGRVGLIVFGSRAEDLTGGVTPDLDRVRDLLNDVSITYGATDLKGAILAGLRAILSTPEGAGDLYLLSDQCLHALPPAGSFTLPGHLEGKVRLVVSELTSGPVSNRTMAGVRVETREGEGGALTLTGRVRCQGRAAEEEALLDLAVNGTIVSRGYVKPAEGSEVAEKVFTLPPQADAVSRATLTLAHDALEADDAHYFLLEARRDLQAVVIDGDPGYTLAGAESYYVERALNPRKSSGSRITPIVVAEGEFLTMDLADVAVIFMLNVADPSPLAPRLTRFVTSGGGLFIALGDRARKERYNRSLAALLPASLGDVKVASPDLTGEKPPALSYPELTHPIFQVFREAGAPVFGTAEFYRLVPTAPFLKPGARVLLKYTHGLPALLERTVGKGRVLLFTSSLDRAWSNFPLKSVFLPFVQESAHYLAHNPAGETAPRSFTVGRPVVLEVSSRQGKLVVVDPGGGEHGLTRTDHADASGAEQQEGPYRIVFEGAQVPGHYRVFERVGETSEPVERTDLDFVVNVPLPETDLTRAGLEEIEARVPGLPVIQEGRSETRDLVKIERTISFTYGLLWGMLGLLALEGILAVVKRRRRPAPAIPEAPGTAGDHAPSGAGGRNAPPATRPGPDRRNRPTKQGTARGRPPRPDAAQGNE